MNYASLILDIDGTLWDSRALVAEGYNLQLRSEGLDHLCVDAEILKTVFGKTMSEIADILMGSIPAPERYGVMERCMETENRYLQTNPCGQTEVAALAQMCHVSESCFRNLFKQYSGKTPSKYCLDNRIFRARQLLESGLYSVAEVAAMVGYRDAGYFTKVFKKETGILPGSFAEPR